MAMPKCLRKFKVLEMLKVLQVLTILLIKVHKIAQSAQNSKENSTVWPKERDKDESSLLLTGRTLNTESQPIGMKIQLLYLSTEMKKVLRHSGSKN